MWGYEHTFQMLLKDPENTNLKLRFCLARLQLNTILVKRLLRDYSRRCKLHVGLLSKLDGSKKGSVESDMKVYKSNPLKLDYYMKQSDLLLKEIDSFFHRKVQVSEFLDNAINDYRVDSRCEFHMLEKEFSKLREKEDFKRLTESLSKCISELRDRRLAVLSSSPSMTMAVTGLIFPHPWYESDWVLVVSCGVILVGAVYFLTKKDDNDGGDSGLTSGINPSRGLLDLLSPKKDSSAWDWFLDFCMNVRLISRRLMGRRLMDRRKNHGRILDRLGACWGPTVDRSRRKAQSERGRKLLS